MYRFSFLVLASGAAAGLVAFACNGSVDGANGNDGGTDSGGASCTTDAECNADPTISRLLGACTAGRCVCAAGATTDGNGKCKPAPTTTTNDAGGGEPCVAKGGMCIGKDQTPPPNHQPSGACTNGDACWMPIAATMGACSADQDCNESPATSSLSGKCFFGVCMCNLGLYAQPNGKCGKTPPGACMASSGKCRQMPAECQAGELPGEMPTNMSCGDFIEAVCCFPATSCKAPTKSGASVDFKCCMPNDGIEDPICVNGWRVCPQGGEARTDTSGCGG